MQLYHSATSPFVRKVMVCLIETGLLDAVELKSIVVSPTRPGNAAASFNPLGKVPCLVTDDGNPMFDSRVITQYLNARAGASLYPRGSALWRTLTLEALGDGIMDAVLAMTYESRLRPEELRWPKWLDAQWVKVAHAMSSVEQDWMGHMAGPLDMGQVSVAVACAYADLRAGDRHWRDAYPVLSEWQTEFAKRPSMVATVPPEDP